MKNIRKCICCGELKPRNEMIKITKENVSQNIVVMPNSKIFGRSAYLCYNQKCVEIALKKNKINRALKTSANVEKAMFDRLFDDK